jgi:16S rRNA (adenine1518-N6/adenine1519-N6)-dimethyltransferase
MAMDAQSINLANADEVRALLRRHGLLRANKALGQHLLVSRSALRAVVEAADLAPDDAVLEVGAGHGALTVELARRARRVVAVELDRAILPVLRETTAPFSNVEIVERNLLDVQPEDLFGADSYKLVANLPYYITAATLRHFLEARNPPRLLVVMVQREVAERMTARAGQMSLLSLSVQFYGAPRIVARVPASAFYPPPKVESAIVRIDLHTTPPLTQEARGWLFTLAHAGFAEKRKQIHNSLARHLDADPERIQTWLDAAEIDPARRAQTLSLDDWLRLTAVSLRDGEQQSDWRHEGQDVRDS